MGELEKVFINSMEHLINETNLMDLLPILLNRNVLPSHMFEIYKKEELDEKNRKAGLFFYFHHLNTLSYYKHLFDALKESGHADLVQRLKLDTLSEMLENNLNISSDEPTNAQPNTSSAKHECVPFELRSSSSSHIIGNSPTHGETPLVVHVEKSTEFYDDPAKTELPLYSTHSRKRGALLMINNKQFINDCEEYRAGAEVDEKNLDSLFSQCGFTIESHEDKKAEQMRDILENFAQSEHKVKGVDMVVIIIMSHGTSGGIGQSTLVLGTDMRCISVQDIVDIFNNDNCPILQKIPKILIFQTCRGRNVDFGVPSRRNRIRTDSALQYNYHQRLRTYSDMFIAQSTLPEYTSHRDPYLGTWYIQAICSVFMKHAHNTHIEDLFKLVDVEIQKLQSNICSVQTTHSENYGFGLCYLHPGLYK